VIGVLVSGEGTNLQALIDAGLPIAAEDHDVDLVVLAGYMHLLTKPFLDRFPDRVVNVHPSLLPRFPGAHAIEDALAANVDTTGVTIHFVDEGLDTGPVIRQQAVPVEPRATLVDRIHAVEHRLLPEVVRELCARS
jgi:phosphoribosylglycinamide formyltransferase-1